MNYWFTSADAPVGTNFVKRFDPLHWTVDFPRGTVASIVVDPSAHKLTVEAEFLRRGDLVGLIFESEDRHAHPAHARETARDYSRTKLCFRWRSTGAVPLDQVNGPTLTIEGQDSSGAPRSWYVRLWNYATGTPEDAKVTIDFDALDGGYTLPAEAERVNPSAIDRMFISIVPPDYTAASDALRPLAAAATVTVSEIRCEGSNSVIAIKDAVVPEHGLRIATAYDDLYHLPPERVIDAVERLGYRGVITHYIGMSHYFALDGEGLLDRNQTFNRAALAWHRDFARVAAGRGYEIIWSLSYELLDMFCPDAWKQRSVDGLPGLTGWEPPSALISPANAEAIGFLGDVAVELAGIALDYGLEPKLQIGEPWWWVTASGAPCLYDDAAIAAFGGNPAKIATVRAPLAAEQLELLDSAGAIVAASTFAIRDAFKAAAGQSQVMLLVYLPTVLDGDAPEMKRANLPVGWAKPAFDALQLEDYEWVTAGRVKRRTEAYAEVEARLGYAPPDQHYLSGFVASPEARREWGEIISAAALAQRRGVGEIFLWALPQVLRDGLTLFGDDPVMPFDDVAFPIEIGAEASVAPAFSTTVVTSASGREFRNSNWQQARLRFDAGPGVRSDSELATLLDFFRARRGAAVGFRFRDPYDFSSAPLDAAVTPTDQMLGEGDGARVRYDLAKHYGTGEERRITRPVAGSVRVAVDGVEQSTAWTLEDGGIVLFDEPPAAGAIVTAGFLFDVPVRFAEDRLEVNRATFLAGDAPSVPLIEIREG